MADLNIKEEYNKLKEKYKLPNFDDINSEFEFIAIDKKGIISRQIRRRMNDKIVFFCNIIERILYPNPQAIPLAQESKFLDDKKDNLFRLYKKLMSYERRSLDLDVRSSKEKEDIDFIKDLLNDWNEIKENISEATVRLKEFWKIKDEKKEKGEVYFGWE